MKELQDQIAKEVGITQEQVDRVLELFAFETHRSFYEAKADRLVELYWNSSPMAFFHLLGILRAWTEDQDQKTIADEYLRRLAPYEHWQPFSGQMDGWKRPEER